MDVFNRIEHFFRRLEIYTGISPTTAMTDMIVEILVEVLTILAIVTKEVKRGRFSELIPDLFTLLGRHPFRKIFEEVDQQQGHRG